MRREPVPTDGRLGSVVNRVAALASSGLRLGEEEGSTGDLGQS